MQPKILPRRTLSVVALIGCIFSIVFLFYSISESSSRSGSALFTANTAVLYKQKKVNSELPTSLVGLPVRLKIPSINVDTLVEYVGLTPDGAMDVPKERADVAWFNLGPRPGENGSAVIDGHYGWKNKRASAFDNLYKLQKGDKLYIKDDKGVIISFVVRESRRYDPEADASGVFGSSDGKVHLNLITCEGIWNKTQKSYSNRLVVFTDKEVE